MKANAVVPTIGCARVPKVLVTVTAAVAFGGLAAACGSADGGSAGADPASTRSSEADVGAPRSGVSGANESTVGSVSKADTRDDQAPEQHTAAGRNDGAAGAAADAGGAAGGGAGTDRECGVNPSAPEITSAVATLSQNQPSRYGWEYIGESNYDRCADLSYAMAETPGATASSPMQLMLFHDGAYVGTGTLCSLPYTTVVGTSDASVDVRYRWLQGDDPSADPTGETTTSYVWDGDSVVMTQPLPPGMPTAGC